MGQPIKERDREEKMLGKERMKERECRGIPDETTVLAVDVKRDHPSAGCCSLWSILWGNEDVCGRGTISFHFFRFFFSLVHRVVLFPTHPSLSFEKWFEGSRYFLLMTWWSGLMCTACVRFLISMSTWRGCVWWWKGRWGRKARCGVISVHPYRGCRKEGEGK